MARVKRYNSETGQWEYCNTGGMPIKGIDYLTRADYDTMRADIDAYLERNKESVGVTVSGNQGAEDVYGASVRVVGEDGSVLEEKAWGGSELVFRMEAGTVYHVEVDASLQGFSNYKSETFTAAKGGARTVTADVYAEKVNVSVEGIDSGFTVTVKEEYTQVEYIESSGTQYIDTGVGLGCEVHADVQFILGTKRSLMGFSTKACRYFGINTEGYYDIGTQAEAISSYSGLERRNIKVLFEEMGISLTAEEETISKTTTTAYEGTLQLLGGSSSSGLTSYPCSARMFGCQIYQGEQLVRDYTPVMNSSGVYGLYDKVNGVFYSSATSTGFTGKAMGDNGVMDTFLTLTETSGSCLVPYGTVYSVSATAVDGYASPSSQTFTANVDSRNVVMVYEENLLGVFIEDTTGKLWTSDAWDGSATANGVAVLTENCRFVMALESSKPSVFYWGGYLTEVSGILTSEDKTVAASDYAGRSNTSILIETLAGTNDRYTDGAPAAEYCQAYTFPNGNKGYMGAAGEWQAVADNNSVVLAALSACGGSAIESSYWTSTQSSSSLCWFFFGNENTLGSRGKNSRDYVRAFTTLKRDTN